MKLETLIFFVSAVFFSLAPDLSSTISDKSLKAKKNYFYLSLLYFSVLKNIENSNEKAHLHFSLRNLVNIFD
jgi:hypothetical protein